MPGLQRVLVVSTSAGAAEVAGLRASHGREPLVLTAPTAEAKRVVLALGVDPQVEVSLAPVRFPPADRGHRLDELVRRHALRDRFRDVVVVVDPATATLLLRTLAPDQLPTSGAVTFVGLPRGDRPVAVRRAVVLGVLLGVVAAAADPLLLLGITGSVGLVLLLVPPWRHLGRELLLAAAISAAVALALVSSSGRFPGGW
ncbi:hypothetical protein [Nocardioides lijunqiniae]|uniref:hypothetical protein n=1 Tax=Nocardioides lijunqiniae TaxID=2760832 RepID=UPI001877E5F7|nr:hypothetical protein [Nocardioides lijunqiniae]